MLVALDDLIILWLLVWLISLVGLIWVWCYFGLRIGDLLWLTSWLLILFCLSFCVVFIDWLLGLVLFVLLSSVGCLVGRFAVGNLALMFRVIILGSCVGFAVVWVLCGAGLLRVFDLCFELVYFVGFWGFRVLFSLVGS